MIDIKRIAKLQKQVETHHPFCARNYIEAKLNGWEWCCVCQLMNKYDAWVRSPFPREPWEHEAYKQVMKHITEKKEKK